MSGSTSIDNSASRGGFPASARPFARRNYGWHIAEGGLYMGGIAFVSADTVLPNMVNAFGGPDWLISVAPILTIAGMMLPQLFAAHWIERMDAVHPYTIRMGFLQRFPYLLGGMALLIFGSSNPTLALYLALAAPLLSSLFSGLCAPAWKELISRTVTPERRASLHGWRNTVGGAIGLLAGFAIHRLLDLAPGPSGYGTLFLICFAILFMSWFAFGQLHEVPLPERTANQSTTLWSKLKQAPGLVRADSQLRNLSIASFTGPSIFILVPFAAVYATEATGRGDSFTGLLVIAKTIGLFVGNIIGGFVGDRFGGRLNLLISRSFRILFCLAIPFVERESLFLVLFALYGMSFTINMLGNQVLSLEIAPDGQRPTYLGIVSALTLPGILIVPLITTLIRDAFTSIWPLAIASIIGSVIGLFALARIREPRQPLHFD